MAPLRTIPGVLPYACKLANKQRVVTPLRSARARCCSACCEGTQSHRVQHLVRNTNATNAQHEETPSFDIAQAGMYAHSFQSVSIGMSPSTHSPPASCFSSPVIRHYTYKQPMHSRQARCQSDCCHASNSYNIAAAACHPTVQVCRCACIFHSRTMLACCYLHKA